MFIILAFIPAATAIFFGLGGGGGGGCCCSCGTPQPASCGCQPSCPPAPSCPVCPPPQPCPPPPAAYCPQVQPVYVSSCSGGSCGGGGCSGGGGCGGDAGYSSSAGGGYVQSSSANFGGYGKGPYATSSGYAPPPPPIPASGYSNPLPAINVGPSYSAGGGGYQQNVEAAALADDISRSVAENSASNQSPAVTQAFRAQECDTPKIKYIMLRPKKSGNGDEFEEEGEEIDRIPTVEATASPLEAKDIGDDITAGIEDALNEVQARAATTFTDAKCNSKTLRELILDNIVASDALSTKRQIHEASMRKFPDNSIDVICSGTGFTYLISTTEHCEAQKDNVICFVYKKAL